MLCAPPRFCANVLRNPRCLLGVHQIVQKAGCGTDCVVFFGRKCHGFSLSGDHLNETVDENAGLVLVLKRLEEGALDNRLRSTRSNLVEHILLLHDGGVGTDDEELIVTRRTLVREQHIVLAQLASERILDDGDSLAKHILLEVVTALRVGIDTQHLLLGDRRLTSNLITEEHIDRRNRTAQEHTDGARTRDVTERSQQNVRRTRSRSVVLRHHALANVDVRIDGASLGIDDRRATVVVIKVRARSVAVSQPDRVNDVEPVLITELRNHLNRSDDGLVKRRTGQVPAIGETEVVRVVATSKGASEQHHLRDLALTHTRREQIDQAEVRVNVGSLHTVLNRLNRSVTDASATVPHTVLLLLLSRSRVLIRLHTVSRVELARGERIHIERNTGATAELHKHEALLKHGHQSATHRTRPVNIHDESVVLTLGEAHIATEQILVELVSGDARHVKHTGLGDAGALGDLSSLAKFELLDQQIDGTLALTNESLLLLED